MVETKMSYSYQLLLIGLIELSFQSTGFAQKKIDWKIYDQDHNQVAEVSAKEISIVHDLIWYRTSQKYGVMDLHKNILIPPKYENIYHYPNGMTSVGVKHCYGMVYRGKEILPLEYSNLFLVDSSGYIRAQKGCSENIEAYIIREPAIYDLRGKLVFQGCEDDVNKFFNELTNGVKQVYDSKKISNGFTLKLLPPDQKQVKKGIYNPKNSLIFSCDKCTISENVNGEFFISERNATGINNVAYTIDTSGMIKIKDDYNQLQYNSAFNLHLYAKGDENGIIDSTGRVQLLAKTTIPNGVQVISGDRFLLSIPDSAGTALSAICDSSGAYLFPPTTDSFQIISNNCLIKKTQTGYLFTNADGKPVSEPYDSVFVIPDFDYRKMVEGDNQPRVGFGSDVHSVSPLDRDGFSPDIKTPGYSHYGIMRDN
ncbi:MAG TPA: WG repeat-containing protein, partial [Cyclobacteriaceae bacterium]